MRKMKKVLAVILALLVLESVVPALAAYTTEDLDNMIIGYFYVNFQFNDKCILNI